MEVVFINADLSGVTVCPKHTHICGGCCLCLSIVGPGPLLRSWSRLETFTGAKPTMMMCLVSTLLLQVNMFWMKDRYLYIFCPIFSIVTVKINISNYKKFYL